MFLVLYVTHDDDYYETPCFVVRDEERAREWVEKGNAELDKARQIPRPTWTIEEAKAAIEARRHRDIWVEKPVRDLEAELAAWEQARRSIVTVWPQAWRVESDDKFDYVEIEERD